MSGMHSHDHAHGATASPFGVLKWAMAATLGLAAVELAGGYLAHSVALVSDAIHNLSDVPTLVVSWIAAYWALRPASSAKTYGYHRAGILAAFTNAVLLVLVALYLLYAAFERLRHPAVVHEAVMMWVSVAALAVNGGITLALVRGRRDLNLRSVLVHNFGDALSNVGILVGAVAIRKTGAQWLDPALGAAIGALVLWSSYGILRDSSHILLEGLPRNMLLEDVARAILRVPGVQEVHDLHIWTLGTDLDALSCHIRIPDMHMEESEEIRQQIAQILEAKFHITHTTIQFERARPHDTGYVMPAPLASKKE